MNEKLVNPLFSTEEIVIIDSCYPSDDAKEVALSRVSAEYVQDLDCCQATSDYSDAIWQTLTIETDDGGGGKFFRIKTGEAGWAFDKVEDFVKILNDFKQRIKCES